MFQRIKSVSDDLTKVKVGLEAIGHYSYNLLGFLLDNGLPTFVINPLHTNLYRKSLNLRKTKTDKVDAHTIASMIMSDVNLKSYAGMSPSIYQSGQLDNCYAHMEKRESRYLRYALYNATKYVCHWDESFGAYLSKKRAEGKHYNVALSHATKKLVRTIYAMEKSGLAYNKSV